MVKGVSNMGMRYLTVSAVAVVTSGAQIAATDHSTRLDPLNLTIVNSGSNLSMQIGRDSIHSAPILGSRSSNVDTFTFRPAGGPQGWDGTFNIIAPGSDKCLDLERASADDGVRIVQRDCNARPSQYWYREPGPGGQCTPSTFFCQRGGTMIRNVHSKKCLDAANGSFPNPPKAGAPIQQWTCFRPGVDKWGVNQIWSPPAKILGKPFPSAEQKAMVDQIIQVRRNLGKCADPSVRIDRKLSDIAGRHSADLAANYAQLIDALNGKPNRGHIGSDGSLPADRIRAGGFTPAQRPENWAYGTNQTLAQAMDLWLYHDEASNWGHRDAILNCEYRVIGVGRASGHNNRVYWTQNFALR